LAAGIGAVGGALAAQPAGAAGVDPVELGQQNQTETSTRVTASGALSDGLFGEATNGSATSSAWGVRGETDSVNGYGVYGRNRTSNGATVGVHGVASSPDGTGVEGTADGTRSATGRGPVGVFGHVVGVVNGRGVLGQVTSPDSEAAGVFGEAIEKGWGVTGLGADDDAGGGVLGICATGDGRGVNAVHQGGGIALEAQSIGGVGAVVGGTVAALRLGPSSGAPAAGTETHSFGELYVDQQTRQLWYCTASGTPGTWAQLSLPSLRAVTPFRVYDSRFGDGPLRLGSTRIVSVADSIDIVTGATLATDAVPTGAVAVTFNLTVFSTVGDGFVAATPGDATSFGTASVNWSGAGRVVGNATLVNLDASRRMKIFIGGTPGAQVGFTVDVTGFLL
ncbi:MAG: hypothetical protein HKN44_06755, partial [Ilumatobacter sp.]|nr:hypothetical protein [Ilumatobacter sp.]